MQLYVPGFQTLKPTLLNFLVDFYFYSIWLLSETPCTSVRSDVQKKLEVRKKSKSKVSK